MDNFKTNKPTLVLYDLNEELVNEWKLLFDKEDNIEIIHASFQWVVEKLNPSIIVTPGNSYGEMTGGIDYVIRTYYGIILQHKVQQEIKLKFNDIICPVGDYVLVDIPRFAPDKLMYLPTMETPRDIQGTDNVYRAFKNVCELFLNGVSNREIIACCGLGTLSGMMTPKEGAKEMYRAYLSVKKKYDK